MTDGFDPTCLSTTCYKCVDQKSTALNFLMTAVPSEKGDVVALFVWGGRKIYQLWSDGPSSLKDDIRQWEHKFSPVFLPLQSEARPIGDSSQQYEDRFYHN